MDPDTPKEAHATEAYTHGDDREYELVFSDEFEVAGRSLADGDDPRWTALNKNDCEYFIRSSLIRTLSFVSINLSFPCLRVGIPTCACSMFPLTSHL